MYFKFLFFHDYFSMHCRWSSKTEEHLLNHWYWSIALSTSVLIACGHVVLLYKYYLFPIKNLLISLRETSPLSLSSSPSPSLAYSPRSLYLHKGLFCAASAPSWQADGGTGLAFSRGHFLTALCSSSAFNIPVVKLFSFTLYRVVVNGPFGQHPCCKVLQRQHTAGACVRCGLLRLFYNAFTDEARPTLWPMSSLLTSDLARVDMCVW